MHTDFNLFPYQNLLPYDGNLNYLGIIIDHNMQSLYMETLFSSLPWKRDEVVIYGKKILTKRKVIWFSDSQKAYKYSQTLKFPSPWTDEMIQLKEIVENKINIQFNSCLVNLYSSGDEGMSWHSDDEACLEKNGSIASLSLGAERRFDFKHKFTGFKYCIDLEPGSLLLMSGEIQNFWLHSLPKTKKVKSPRINLTFRNMVIV